MAIILYKFWCQICFTVLFGIILQQLQDTRKSQRNLIGSFVTKSFNTLILLKNFCEFGQTYLVSKTLMYTYSLIANVHIRIIMSPQDTN